MTIGEYIIMMKIFPAAVAAFLPLLLLTAAPKPFSEPAPRGDEWGFRPAAEERSAVTPVPFVWKPQEGAASYELEYARNPEFTAGKVRVPGLAWNVYCPERVMVPGAWFWRVRFLDRSGAPSAWSSVRRFSIGEDATELPMPSRREYEARIPKTHPRLFLRPEELPELRERAGNGLKTEAAELFAECDRLLASPPDSSEPPKYPEGMKRGTKEWQKIWWGNRMRTLAALDGAATLGFGYRLTGNRAWGNLAKKLLMECAKWDPKGSTSRAYNDEAGIPFLSRFSRTYSYVYDLLSEEEREECRNNIRIRGNEFYTALCPSHFYKPYNSHDNRAWHFLGEAAVAFYGEIPEAADWLEFAMNVYFCVYPVWGDDDGGWHEGLWYWGEYFERFFYWGDVMRNTFDIEVCAKPFFSKAGYYAMYCQPPNTQDGGFGDHAELHRGSRNVIVMRSLAALSGNPYWQWFAEQSAPTRKESSYITFLRGAQPKVAPKAPDDLPTSRCFRGNGLAFLNTDLSDGQNNVQLLFKSSPRGTASHGYDANNSFILNAFGERLLIRSGRRDSYASNFHKNWMWDTKSVNCITVDGGTQKKCTFDAKGEITDFSTGKRFDFVAGEAAGSYPGNLNGFRRRILFCKPSAVLIVDTLEAKEPAGFAWLLHAVNPMRIDGAQVDVENNGASCRIDFLYPSKLNFSQTDKFDPPLPEYVKLVQHHLTATPAEKSREATFITLLRPRRTGEALKGEAKLTERKDGYRVAVELPEGRFEADIPKTGKITAKLNGETFQE